MTKELLQQALECFEEIILHDDQHVSTAKKGAELLCRAIAQPVPPIASDNLAIGAGAVYDFAGFLTTRNERITLSGFDEAGPAAEAIKEFLNKRGITDGVIPAVGDWHKVTQPVPMAQEGDAKDARLNADEIYEILSALDDHNGDDFEPECPGCTAYKKLAAIASQKATK